MAENMRTKDGSTIGMVLRDVERLRPKKFKLVNGFDLNYSFDGRLSGVSVCYWIGEKRTDDDAYCDLGYRLSADKTSLEHEYDSLSQDEIDALTLTALEFGKESFLRHVDRRYQTRDTTTIIENGAAIQALLAQIPAMSMEVGRMTLAERLASLGVSVRFVFTGHLSLEEVTSSEGLYKTGDELFVFHTSEHPAGASDGCPIVSSVSFIKRGKSWLPQSKTANYYAFGSCKAPG